MLTAGIISLVAGTVTLFHGSGIAATIIGSALTSGGVSLIINWEFRSYRRSTNDK